MNNLVKNNNLVQLNSIILNELLEKYGAVSDPVAKSMALGALELFKSHWAISVSGIAGPSGGSTNKPVGLVELCIAGRSSCKSIQENFGSHRERIEIQKLSVIRALDELRLSLINPS